MTEGENNWYETTEDDSLHYDPWILEYEQKQQARSKRITIYKILIAVVGICSLWLIGLSRVSGNSTFVLSAISLILFLFLGFMICLTESWSERDD